MRFLVRFLEFVRFAPKGTTKITEELIISRDSLVAGGKGGVFTPMFCMVGRRRSRENLKNEASKEGVGCLGDE